MNVQNIFAHTNRGVLLDVVVFVLNLILMSLLAKYFVSILIYFPPRIFYLAEDINRPTAWLTILLANSPVILRVLFGLNLNVTG